MTDQAEAPPSPTQAKPDVKANFTQLPLVEKVLGVIALIIIIGWIMAWTSDYYTGGFFSNWFTPLSFLGALAIIALIALKTAGIRPLPPQVEAKVIPIASLLPVVGYLISLINSPYVLLTQGGSIALAYISATTYWKRRIPEFATAPLGSSAPPPPGQAA